MMINSHLGAIISKQHSRQFFAAPRDKIDIHFVHRGEISGVTKNLIAGRHQFSCRSHPERGAGKPRDFTEPPFPKGRIVPPNGQLCGAGGSESYFGHFASYHCRLGNQP